jgi:hypothetical protein
LEKMFASRPATNFLRTLKISPVFVEKTLLLWEYYIDSVLTPGEGSMKRFSFYELPPASQEQLRADRARCILLLRQCRDLAAKLASVAGIYTPLTAQDEEALQGFHLVAQAYEQERYSLLFEELRQSAGLLPSDVGLLAGRVETLFYERDPERATREATALINNWLSGSE